MRKTLVKAGLAAAAILFTSSSAYAQLATANINATAVVLARGRITLTGTINFPDTDPFTNPTIIANALTVQALARVAPGAGVSLTVQAGGNFVSGRGPIAINNLTWAGAGAGFAGTGTIEHDRPARRQLDRTWCEQRLADLLAGQRLGLCAGHYPVTLTYTLTTP